ncbi:MAG: protein kinase domain-containing protein [Candidatus Eiseniibacteriota bacterium]
MPLAEGTRLGPYQILAPLGAGGMGEVYRAHDSRLGRDVAIKVLPQHLATTPEVRARFEREARTISQLNHPHICTLYDVGHQNGTDYLVMELLEGETLADRLQKGPLPIGEIASLGRQIAEALHRAHRAGVVHRDLKPGNVMLTKGGAKLMDFGLARPAGLAAAPDGRSQSPTMSRPLTAEGTIVGTFQYMAPEQLEGKETDARTDVWALGCVLYEMATGAPAFAGESQASLIAAIMTGEPRPITELRPVAPPGLDRTIRRCLAKDPESRPQSAHDVAFMLDLVAGDDPRRTASGIASSSAGASAGDTASESASTSPLSRAMPWFAAVSVLVFIVATFLVGRWTAPQSGEGSIRVSTLSQGDQDSWPAVSPDGRLVAFSAVRQNGQGLWVMDMVTRSEVKLTAENDQFSRFTPDGGNIVFTRIVNGRQSLWRIPVIGGRPRLLLEDAFDADPSPDGTRIAYIASAADSAGTRARLMVAKADGTDGHELWSRGSISVLSPRWSPDGSHIAIVRSSTQNALNSIVLVNAKDGSSRDFVSPSGAVLSTASWDGAGTGLIVAEGVGLTAVQRGAPGRLFRLDTRSGKYRPLGWLDTFPPMIDLHPDGRVVMASFVARQNLCEVPIDARNLVEGRWLTGGLAIDRQPVYSPDGKWVMFSSNRGGALDLWEVSVETGEMHRVTDDPADDWDPEYGPNGESIFWCSARSGAFEIWTGRRDGSAPRQLSRDSLDAENPSVSSDGAWVVYSSAHPAKSGLWRIPVAGGVSEWLLKTASVIPDLSPDDRHVSVITDVGTIETRLDIFDVVEKKTLPVPVPIQVFPSTVQFGRSRFTSDGGAVAYIHSGADGQPILLRRPLSAWRTGAGRVDTLFTGTTDAIESFGFSPDGKRATVSVVDWLSGLTVADGISGLVPPKQGRQRPN